MSRKPPPRLAWAIARKWLLTRRWPSRASKMRRRMPKTKPEKRSSEVIYAITYHTDLCYPSLPRAQERRGVGISAFTRAIVPSFDRGQPLRRLHYVAHRE